ncbi:uncharacterized protein LOC129602559 [Paramacrobiotus metropolitanus]|uniref:uncharacterized protein LOC129602559 n=1 Tax=Paramacrobiotus metropolitanus TaxID=2943436 RepID=UPI002445E657|nr:uncharacterized protein LOC129602559 [Paramacrobiotus metropolitanus]XP_055357580.1 uncharacterized protein LOC129602559 [Paramacrobiotus metropolitanus]
MSKARAGVPIELHMDSLSDVREALKKADHQNANSDKFDDALMEDTLHLGVGARLSAGSQNNGNHAGDCDGSLSWHEKVIVAVESQSCSELENLLLHPSTVVGEIQRFAEDIVIAVACSLYEVSSDFESVLQMLMFLIVEYGKPAELIVVFHTFFDKDEFPGPDCATFFLPNIQATLLKLEKFRLMELQSMLSQIDYFVADFHWNATADDDFTSLVHLQSLVCDFVQPFVNEVSLYRESFDLPPEKDFSALEIVKRYRNCIARALLHILAEPLGIMPVSFAEGFKSYQRIIGLLGKVIGDFTIFSRWSESDQNSHEDGYCEDYQIPINSDSIANLAFLVRYCAVQPNHYPSPLCAVYYFCDIFVPFSNSHGVYALQQHVEFLKCLLDELSEERWTMDNADFSALSHLVSDLLVQASAHPNSKVRRKIYFVVCTMFSLLSPMFLINFVLTVWKEELMQSRPNALEVLTMVVKRPIINQLQLPNWNEDHITERQFVCLFKTFLQTRREGSVADWAGLASSIMGIFTMILGMDRTNRTGISDLISGMEDFCNYWETELRAGSDAIKNDAWVAQEESRTEQNRASRGSAGLSGNESVETVGEKVESQLAWSSLISMAVDSLRNQLALHR